MTALFSPLAAGGGAAKTYADDVFSAYTYTGNGATQTITNGIDLAGKGGLVWAKSRTTATFHYMADTARGTGFQLNSNSTNANGAVGIAVTSFNSDGFSLGSYGNVNTAADAVVSWTFRKAPKFFDIVTFTAGSSTNRRIAHSLGVAPGMVLLKKTSGIEDWYVYHASTGSSQYLLLNSTNSAAAAASLWPSPSASDFGVNESLAGLSGTYVAYLFAHDTSTDGLIQCGSFTSDGSGNATVNLGWEPQYLMYKASSSVNNWEVDDQARGWSNTGWNRLLANTSDAETAVAATGFSPIATGFSSNGRLNASTTYIYLAIRRPNRPPATGTQVYNAIARTGTGAAATVTGVGFAPDMWVTANRDRTFTGSTFFLDRLRGISQYLFSNLTNAEGSGDTDTAKSFTMDGVSFSAAGNFNPSGYNYINHFFKRAPGVFEQICFTGTGVAHTEAHGLGAAPELWVVKGRSGATDWVIGSTLLANTERSFLNTTAAKVTDATCWNSTYPTAANLSLGTYSSVNTSAATYTAYMWASLSGISKVFSYTGNGTSQTVACGFSAGARFVMIFRVDSTSDKVIFDTVRGIVASNDPHLSLNTTAAEVTTDDSIDPDPSGFIINQIAATNLNVTGGVYLGIAYA